MKNKELELKKLETALNDRTFHMGHRYETYKKTPVLGKRLGLTYQSVVTFHDLEVSQGYAQKLVDYRKTHTEKCVKTLKKFSECVPDIQRCFTLLRDYRNTKFPLAKD